MKDRIFSISLFNDGFCRLKTIGITATALLIVQTILLAITLSSNNVSCYSSSSGLIVTYLNPLIVTVYMIFVPLMAFILFNFLNKRNGSDFYHSLPFTRTALYVSFALSVFAWVVVISAASTAVALIAAAIINDGVGIAVSTFITLMLKTVFASFFMLSAILVAVSLTGKTLNSFIAAALLFFGPRYFLFCVSYASRAAIPIFVNSTPLSGTLFDMNNNTAFGAVIDMAKNFSYTKNIESYIYTIVAGIIYFCLGLIIFKRRRSETAGSASLSKWVAYATGIVISFVVSIVGCTVIFINNKNNATKFKEFGLPLIWLFVIAVIVYAVYELIVFKKAKALLKSLLGLAVVAVLSVLSIGAMQLSYNSALNFEPSASEITALNVESDYDGYLDKQAGSVDIKNKQLNALMCDALKEDNRNIRKGKYESIDLNSPKEWTVTFKIGKKSTVRIIRLDKNQSKIVDKILKADKNVREAFCTLPEYNKSTDVTVDYIGMSVENRKKVYNMFREELKTADFDKWYKEYHSDKYVKSVGQMNITAEINGKEESAFISITELTPKTYDYVLSLMVKTSDIQKLEEVMKDYVYKEVAEDTDGIQTYISMDCYNMKTPNGIPVYSFDTALAKKPIEGAKIIEALGGKYTDKKPTADTPLIAVFYDKSVYKNGEYIEKESEAVSGYYVMNSDVIPDYLVDYAMTTE